MASCGDAGDTVAQYYQVFHLQNPLNKSVFSQCQ